MERGNRDFPGDSTGLAQATYTLVSGDTPYTPYPTANSLLIVAGGRLPPQGLAAV